MYSASAEVLMLRTLGIPARMAVGFAQGTYDEERDRYIVARLNAHAWPEVYFPGIGWVEFEPTGNQNPLSRPVAPQDTGTITPPNASLLGEEFLPPEQENIPVETDPVASTNNSLLYLLLVIPLL